ncbi:UDP-galactose transporter [Punctularia strigosozonata HHB-11173 SS5]|uniref:UDP-galactose transporter n=1 Tax=Punctularia strigosozonata (strain HHB-11173) TaxID=741275 RepID=UPI0004416822|nr:UDP-galactose transporter [Punctularia strigosozonata HHB-11173 SS5]EIN06181.1 UDP-galactose transporter [Punctularia strigosozonata HHB-11173 SS5]
MSADRKSAQYERVPGEEKEQDVVEIKKALATTPSKEHIAPTGIASIACYCVASILMTVVNKYVVSGRQFNMNFLLLAIQSSVCCACVFAVKRAGIISFRDFSTQDAKAWFPVSFLLVSVIYTGSKSLQYLNIPVYTIFKNLTIILIAYGEVLWFGGRVTALTFVSFIFMVFSSVIAAWSDVTTASADSASEALLESEKLFQGATYASVIRNLNVGYFWMLLNCISSAGYVLIMRKRIKATGFSDWDSMFYNNLLSIPVLAVFSIIAEDWGTENLIRNFPPESRNILLFAIAFSGAAAVGISYTTAWCIRETSSTTYSMVGALNKLPVAASGMIFFGDAVTLGSVSAIGVGFFAGLLYAVAKNNQKKAESAAGRDKGIIPLSNRSKD